MAASLSLWDKVQTYIWLSFGVICLFFATAFWAMNDSQKDVVEVEKQPETEIELHIQPEKVTSMTHLGAFHQEVKPLDMTERVATTAQHEAEFRGNKFIQDHQNKYAIELFRVNEEDIIKVFLRKQDNRKPFIYLRLSGDTQTEQYVLFYGNYANEKDAKAALASLSVRLAESVQPKIVPWSDFTNLVNDLGADELVTQKIYAVHLKATAVPKVDELELQRRRAEAARAAEVEREEELATTTTTVTRRDADGNVIDVEHSESHGNSSTNSANTVQEVVDPFN